MGRDYYATLGLPQNATDKQIRERFLQLTRERHPDLVEGAERAVAESEFQEITEAFNALSDPTRRREHDLEITRPAAQRRIETGQAARVYLRRGVKAYREKNYLEAAENFDRATSENPKDPQSWHYLALACRHRRQWLPRALAAATKACDLEPMNPVYLKLAGELAAQAGQNERAARYLNEALTWGGDEEELQAALDQLGESKRKPGSSLFGRSG